MCCKALRSLLNSKQQVHWCISWPFLWNHRRFWWCWGNIFKPQSTRLVWSWWISLTWWFSIPQLCIIMSFRKVLFKVFFPCWLTSDILRIILRINGFTPTKIPWTLLSDMWLVPFLCKTTTSLIGKPLRVLLLELLWQRSSLNLSYTGFFSIRRPPRRPSLIHSHTKDLHHIVECRYPNQKIHFLKQSYFTAHW